MALKRLLIFLLDLLFPPRCVFCGEVIAPGRQVCKACAREIVPVPTVRRMNLSKSGKNIPCVVLYPYAGKVRDSVIRFKFGGEKSYAGFYSERMVSHIAKLCPETAFDWVVPVPISAQREKQRGYNQSKLIARKIAAAMNIRCSECLEKTRDNPEQHKLNKTERRKNVAGAYQVSGSEAAGRKILLVDDIVTTGATLSECAETLYRSGADSVVCTAVAESALEGLQ